MTAALEGAEWSAACPGRTLPLAKTQYPLYRRLGGPQGQSGQVENLVPNGTRSRTVQPIVSLYTDWAESYVPIQNSKKQNYNSLHINLVCRMQMGETKVSEVNGSRQSPNWIASHMHLVRLEHVLWFLSIPSIPIPILATDKASVFLFVILMSLLSVLTWSAQVRIWCVPSDWKHSLFSVTSLMTFQSRVEKQWQ